MTKDKLGKNVVKDDEMMKDKKIGAALRPEVICTC